MFILSAHQQSFPALCAKKVIVIVAHNYANEKTFHKNHYVYFAVKSDSAAPDPGARGNKKNSAPSDTVVSGREWSLERKSYIDRIAAGGCKAYHMGGAFSLSGGCTKA